MLVFTWQRVGKGSWRYLSIGGKDKFGRKLPVPPLLRGEHLKMHAVQLPLGWVQGSREGELIFFKTCFRAIIDVHHDFRHSKPPVKVCG